MKRKVTSIRSHRMNYSMRSLALLVMVISLGSQVEAYSLHWPHWLGGKDRSLDIYSYYNFKNKFNKLFTDYARYDHLYNIALTSGADAQELSTLMTRSLQNADAIGAAFAPYYRKDLANGIATLFKRLIQYHAELGQALALKDTKKAQQVAQLWRENTQELALLLNSINRYISTNSLSRLMGNYLSLTAQDVTTALAKDWSKNARITDEALDANLKLADNLTESIIKQFHKKFQ